MILQSAIDRVLRDSHYPMAKEAFGQAGVDAVFLIMDAAKSLYRHLELERVSGRLVIFKRMESHPQGTSRLPGTATDFASLASQTVGDVVIEIDSNGAPYLQIGMDTPLDQLAMGAVVYHWNAGREEFMAGTERKEVMRFDSASRSQFAVPTLGTLREALRRYAVENVRESSCYIFDEVWNNNGNRIFLKSGPEHKMRDSLTLFLKNRIGADHDVWREQNTDDEKPIDIQVTPRFSNNRVMLIEIKWLGWSVAEDGHVTARYSNARAQAGADQLAGYIDKKKQSAPTSVVHGYLVVIDCRRRNLREGTTTITKDDALYYEGVELRFDPAHHTQRVDFDPPYRMFARPVCCG